MATFTIQGTVNIDSLGTKAGNDVYNINGGYLTVDQDSRYGTNQNTSAAMGNITLSAVSGGTIEFNSTLVRLIKYTGGTGNVPAFDTSITKSGSSGKLIGVYSALNVAPTTVGAAMPASGFIKIRQWNNVAYTNGALGGIGATAISGDTAGWIEIVGVDAATCSVNRLNTFKVRGDWYYFDGVLTDGVRATTYQIPSNGSIVYLPGVWVETGSATNNYEFYPCAGSLSALIANIQTTELQGKACWISTAGLLRFGHDGTNSTGGYVPPAGRRIRMPNIFFMCCTSATPTANVLPNSTLATRYDFTTTGGGNIDIDKAMLNWYPSFAQPYSVSLNNVGIMSQLSCSEIASPISWSYVGVGQEAANTQISLLMSLCFAGGFMSSCTWSRSAQAASGAYVNSLTDINGITVTNEKIISFVKAANATTGSATMIRVANSSWENTIIGGGRIFMTTCTNIEFKNSIYYDNIARTTASSIPMYIYDIGTNCSNITFDGVSFSGYSMVQPYNGILQVGAAGCSDIKLRNLGTYSAPLDLGNQRVDDATWTRATTTATVTSNSHGLTTGNIIYVIISSDTGAIAVASKTITVTGSNTFTFTCLNAGSSSGTLSYYPTMSAYLFGLAAGAAANNIKIQRCYTTHTRTNLYTSDNSSKNITLENVYGDFINAPTTPMLNGKIKGVGSSPSLAAQTSCYGTHWFDVFTSDITPSISGVSWTRTSTTATVTSIGHNLKTNDRINVYYSSDEATIVLGEKTITALSSNTFTFTCLNAGSSSGTISFNPLHGRVGLLMNEATSDTTDQYTLDSGSTAFTSAGGLFMPLVGDEITFEIPYYIIGHESFPISEAVMAGGTIGNYHIKYSIDKNDGNDFGAFKNLYYPRSGGGGSVGSTTVTMTDASGVEVGDYIWGTNIGYNAKVTGITNGTTVTVDKVNLGTVSGVLRFNHLPTEDSIIASLGFKFKINIKTKTNNGTAISSLYFFTNSTNTSRGYQYPLDPVDVSITFDTLQQNSEVRIYRTIDDVELSGIENSSTAFTYSYEYIGVDTPIYVRIHHLDYEWLTYENLILSNVSQNIPVQQRVDRYYLNP